MVWEDSLLTRPVFGWCYSLFGVLVVRGAPKERGQMELFPTYVSNDCESRIDWSESRQCGFASLGARGE